MRKSVSGWNENEVAREFTTTARVRYAETDAMGWVYYGRYFVYFEMGRTELMRDLGRPYSDIERNGVRLPVVLTGCRYYAGAHYDDLLRIVTRACVLTAYRLRFDYRIFVGETMLCEGFTEHCFIDQNGKLAKVPRELVEKIEQR
jgi:acyl-CoA thioester hydrolase